MLKSFFLVLFFSTAVLANVCVFQLAKIYHRVEFNRFEIRRGIQEYRVTLGRAFQKELASLGPDDLYIDSGAGASIALSELHLEKEDYHTPVAATPRTCSIVVKRPTVDELIQKEKELELIPYQYSEKMRRDYYQRRFDGLLRAEQNGKHEFKEALLEKIPSESLKARLISDVMGPFSYAKDFPSVIRKYLEMLVEGGSVFIHTEQSKTSVFDGKDIQLFAWIKSHVKGADVTIISPSVIQLKRNSEAIELPDLNLLAIHDGAPPSRAYEAVVK